MLTLLRHGESEFNRARRFTGWADVDLTPAGEAQAAGAAAALRRLGIAFDACFTSALRRASRSAEILLRAMDLEHVRREQTWRLNERHYGALQGLDAWSAVRRFGVLDVLRARRDYAHRPPSLDAGDASSPAPPGSESLADVRARVVPFWQTQLAPELARGRSVLVVSHKHALRALFAVLTGIEGRPASLRVPHGVPIVLTLDGDLAVTGRRILRRAR